MGGERVTTPVPAPRSEDAPTESARQLQVVLANIAEGVNIVDANHAAPRIATLKWRWQQSLAA